MIHASSLLCQWLLSQQAKAVPPTAAADCCMPAQQSSTMQAKVQIQANVTWTKRCGPRGLEPRSPKVVMQAVHASIGRTASFVSLQLLLQATQTQLTC